MFNLNCLLLFLPPGIIFNFTLNLLKLVSFFSGNRTKQKWDRRKEGMKKNSRIIENSRGKQNGGADGSLVCLHQFCKTVRKLLLSRGVAKVTAVLAACLLVYLWVLNTWSVLLAVLLPFLLWMASWLDTLTRTLTRILRDDLFWPAVQSVA